MSHPSYHDEWINRREAQTIQQLNSKSAQPCGCDAGANWVCKFHNEQVLAMQKHPNMGGLLDGVPADTFTVSAEKWEAPVGIKDSGERVTYASGSMRDPSTGKIKWSRITFGPMMRRWAQHLTNAEVKYPDPQPGVPNFTLIETEEEYQRYKESAFRHFLSWFYEETDEDHASATFFNINGVEIIKDKRRARAAAEHSVGGGTV